MSPPWRPGERLLAPGDREATARSILELQDRDGRIPRAAGDDADPWNHLEAAMALAAAGEQVAAERALEWLLARQRPDGAFHAAYGPRGAVADGRLDTSGTAYLAVALRQCALAGGEPGLLQEHFGALRRALRFVLDQQRSGGEVCWSGEPPGSPGGFALLAGCSSIYASLLAGAACAEAAGRPWPELEGAAARLASAICWRRSAFLPKDEFAMDWYYPVLAGVLPPAAARHRVAGSFERFVRLGEGVLCRSDRRWVTTAETAECALACLRCGLEGEARRLLAWTEAQRRSGGAYLTGLVYPERSEFPPGELTSYSAAAVLLAEDALAGGITRTVLAGGRPDGVAGKVEEEEAEGEEAEGAAG